MSHGNPLTDVSEHRADQLAALAVTYRDAKEAFEAHRDRLHDAVVEAIDAGMSPADAARTIGVSVPRVYRIIERVCRLQG